MNTSLAEMKAPVMELPMKMDESMMRQTMELSTVIGTYLTQLCSKADEIVAAMTHDSEYIKIDPAQLPLAVTGNLGGSKVPSTSNYLGNIGTAASGQLGDALRSEIKNKPAGSDLVIANSSETIIPATGFPTMSGGGGGSEIKFGDINVVVSGVNDPEEIASQVAEQILTAVRRSGYGELYTS
jgi:hypothetical protein